MFFTSVLLKGGTCIYTDNDSKEFNDKLNFKLTEKNGDYGMLFNGSEPVAFAMFNKDDFSLSVAYRKGEGDMYSKGDVLASVFTKTKSFYGVNDYRVTENDFIFNAHNEKYIELNN